jgi:hypothetical protein
LNGVELDVLLLLLHESTAQDSRHIPTHWTLSAFAQGDFVFVPGEDTPHLALMDEARPLRQWDLVRFRPKHEHQALGT